LNVIKTVNAGDTVADAKYATNFCNFGFLAEVLNLVLEDRGDSAAWIAITGPLS